MKVSEIVMLVLTRGIWTENRALTTIMMVARIRSLKSNFGAGKRNVAAISDAAPATTMIQR